jgi:pancreatic triacylglycerol lipase
MNLLGFSLGAQIIARTSRRVQQISNRRHVIGRLSGLDPWALNLIQSNQIGTLSADDAYWTESIHTEGNSRGDLESRGHLAFMVNGGVSQPMCEDLTLPGNRADCSHLMALTIWTESVRTLAPSFPSLQCTTWPLFMSGSCNNNQVAHIGRTGYNEGLRGIYFLQTNMQSPFSRSQAQP